MNENLTEWLFAHCFHIELEFGNAGFCGGRKTGVSREKPSGQRREPTTNRESNPGHNGARRALSPLRYPCSPKSI